MTPAEASKILVEFNKWRRGEPPYDWSDDPAKRKELPYTPTQIGEAIDIAVPAMKGENPMNNEAINVAIPKICQTCEHHRLYEGTAFDAPSRGKRRLAIECAVKEFPKSWQCDQWKLASCWNPDNVPLGDLIHIVKVNGPL